MLLTYLHTYVSDDKYYIKISFTRTGSAHVGSTWEEHTKVSQDRRKATEL